MSRVSRHMENSLISLMTKALAHSAGDSRKSKLVPSTSLPKKVSLLGREASSHLVEDVVPPRPPSKEGLKFATSKSKSKTKNVEVPKKLVIDTIPDTDDDDDDMGDTDDSTGLLHLLDSPSPKKARLDAFASEPVLDSEGQPMFDPSSIRHPNSTEWFPTPHVGEYISSKLRLPLDKSVRAKLKSECPKPSLPCHVTVTPSIDQPLLTFFSKFGKDPRRGVDKAWSACQDKLLDVVGPLARVLDMAETARLEGSDLDPEEISLWLQRSFCLLGNANAAITQERRKGLLIKLDPKLANLATQDPGVKADGLLFGDSLVKDLSRYVSTFASLDKAQFSIKKVFTPRVFGRAGRGRNRSSGRGYPNQGSRGAANSGYQEFKPQFYPQRGRGFRGRGQKGFRAHNNNVNNQGEPSPSYRRTSCSFSSQVARAHGGSLGPQFRSRLSHRVLRSAFPVYFSSSVGFFRRRGSASLTGDPKSSSQTSHPCRSLRSLRFSKLPLFGSKKEQKSSSSHQSQVVQPVRGLSPLQDGDHSPSQGYVTPIRLDGQARSTGRISFNSYTRGPHQISTISVVRRHLPILFSSFRTFFRSLVLHQSDEASGVPSALPRYSSHHLSRRYLDHALRHADSSFSPRDCSVPPSGSGFPHQFREIYVSPFPECGISGLPSGLFHGISLSPELQSFSHSVGIMSNSSPFRGVSSFACKGRRPSVSLHSSDLSRTSALSSSAALEDSSSAPRLGVLGSCPAGPRISSRVTMVDRPFRCVERENDFCNGPRSCIRIRCQPVGLGRPMWFNLDWRYMVSRGVVIAHKLFRDAGRLLCNPQSGKKQSKLFHPPSDGQCFCGSLHKPSRWHKVKTAGGTCKEPLALLSSTQAISPSGISPGQSQRHRRLALSIPSRFKRLEAASLCLSFSLPEMGSLFYRSLRFPAQFPTSRFLQLETGPSCSRDGCIPAGLVSVSQLCVSSVRNDQQGSGPGSSSVDIPGSPGSFLASPNLVPLSLGARGGLSGAASLQRRSPARSSGTSTRLDSGQLSSSVRLEDLRSSAPDVFISQEASIFISRAWAPGTSRAYKSAWSLWASWCMERSVDPFSAPLSLVVNFLASKASAGTPALPPTSN
ncbi:uncharacterized protein LOC144770021 [Lissotriton helveticus]